MFSLSARGTTLNCLGNIDLKKINIKLYDLNRQNEIVTNLSKIDNLINLKNNQIYKLEQLVKSQFVNHLNLGDEL